MTDKAATKDTLGALHAALAEALAKKLNDPECAASVLKEAREFLKDNGIEAGIGNAGIKKLSAQILPFNGENDEAVEATR